MLHFYDHHLIFLEVPKTGTSSIVHECLRRAPLLVRNRLFLNDSNFVELSTHATSQEIRDLLDKSKRRDKILAFIRNPVELICSKYSFYRSGRAYQQFIDPGFHASLSHKLNVLLARSFPLILYALFVPYKSSSHFLLDSKGELNVDYLFDYDDIDHACEVIFCSQYKIYEVFTLPKLNQSNSALYLSNKLSRRLLTVVASFRLRKDYLLWKRANKFGPLSTRETAYVK